MKLSDMLVPTYVQMLKALAAWLAKAEEQSSEGAETLAPARLAADMVPLSTQIRFACVQAYEGIYRLRGEELPDAVQVLLDEGRAAADRPGSLADAITRIDETASLPTCVTLRRSSA